MLLVNICLITDDEFPVYNPEMRHMNITIDFSQWAHPDDRHWGGKKCLTNTNINSIIILMTARLSHWLSHRLSPLRAMSLIFA